MPIDFTLNDISDAAARSRQFAEDVLSGVPVATRDLPSPIERFVATRPFFERLVAEGYLRKCIPVSVGGDCAGLVDLAILAEEFYTVDANGLTHHALHGARACGRWWLAANQSSTNSFCRPFLRPRVHRLPHFASTEPGGSANVGSTARRRRPHHARRLATRGSSRAGSNGYLRPPDGTDRVPTCSLVVCRTDANVEPSRGISIIAVPRPDSGLIFEHRHSSTCWDTVPILTPRFRWTLFRFRPEIC